VNKTVAALDELVSSIISLVPTWLSMLKSTRVLTLIGTGFVMYWTASQGGLTDVQTMIIQAAEAFLGVSFIGFKTLRSETKPVDVVVATTPTPTSTPVVVVPTPKIPFRPEAFMNVVMGKVGTMYGEVTDSTIFYTAESTYHNAWNFDNEDARADCVDLLIGLAKKAFETIWGRSWEDEAVYVPTMEECLPKLFKDRAVRKGTKFYSSYLDVFRAISYY
jgi:hypothetical protein